MWRGGETFCREGGGGQGGRRGEVWVTGTLPRLGGERFGAGRDTCPSPPRRASGQANRPAAAAPTAPPRLEGRGCGILN